ncbi:Eco57I restriction-modification methylase domain-containing protein [Natrinema gelatinilyticum]|uniref:Eco57I restriction-modification methylase domain-containing protein n=1 Tax=Natrinema gelatinilyticum TaxID=2961571 RepID=UPI0020C3D83B|nr:DNA methyltransferase [Natrinema gelatinilyticum]
MSKSEHTSDSSAPGTDPTYIPSNESTSFIETSGGLLTEQTILSLRQERFDHPAAKPETFALPGETPPTENELEEEIALVWEDLVERWDEVTQKGKLFEMDISEARSKWILKLFQTLDFEPVYQRAHLEVEGMEFDLSHKGWPDDEIADYGEMGGATAPILHTVAPESERDQDKENKLDRKPEGAGRGASTPHDTLQNFLNASQDHNWAIITDGVTLRVLRDYYHTYTRGYVEFDLENIFTSRNYQDFRALYRLCHPSRFLPRDEDALNKSVSEVLKDDRDESTQDDEAEISTPLEMLYQASLSTGIKVGQDLQSNVISALETLGNGLLNPDIREFLREGGEEEAQEYYQELLMVIYRLLFLLYAEQRGMMPGRDSLYTDEYSITKLRERAERRRGQDDNNTDLWHGLQATFELAEKGSEDLGVPAYNGMLFDSDRLEHISGSECTNEALLSAIADLTLIEREGVLQRISYADLGVEEVGSIYESLLEFTPRLAEEHVEFDDQSIASGEFYLDDRGTERKETGSYYTDPQLVQELIKSALEPVVDDRLESADDTKEAQEEALLDITVVDPACGSAAFLIAATNYLGKRLAQIREEMEYPLEDDVRDARRSVLQHCIYGVDLNPMAVELAKVSLWIDSAVEDKPLNFLDHHIKCGNSLLGTTQDLVEQGVPVDAYETSKGREGHVGNELRKRVRKENKDYSSSNSRTLDQFGGGIDEYASHTERLNEIEEDSSDDIHKKEMVYEEFQDDLAYQREKLAYDVWAAAFFWPLDGSAKEYPTPKTIKKIRKESRVSDSELSEILQHVNQADEWSESVASVDTDILDVVRRARQTAESQRFFHWELEFPEVYRKNGFDCILGNPPWEKIKLQENEFFEMRNEKIVEASTKAKRKQLIEELSEKDPTLYKEYQEAVHASESLSNFLRNSGRFPLTAVGDINTYQVFTGLARQLIANGSRAGLIVPSGLLTDFTYRDFFADLVESNDLDSFYGFENKYGLFPEVHREFKFGLLTLDKMDKRARKARIAFALHSLRELRDEERIFELTEEDLQRINPNTKTCPIYKNRRDAELNRRLYRNNPVLINENKDENPWGASLSTMFHMSNDSGVFNTHNDLKESGCKKIGNRFIQEESAYFPLYEGRTVWLYDHRASSIGESANSIYRSASTEETTYSEHRDREFCAWPRYWVDEEKVNQQLGDNTQGWLLGFRDVTTPTAERTMVCSIIPRTAVGNKLPQIMVKQNAPHVCGFLANLCSMVLDYATRCKLNYIGLNFYIVKQLPIHPPERYTSGLLQFIVPRILELTYTAWDLTAFADDVWGAADEELRLAIEKQWQENAETTDGGLADSDPPEWVEHSHKQDERFPRPPFLWDKERRIHLRAEIDALYSHLYGLKREDLAYILDTFPIVKQKDENEYGDYRTKNLILEYFDEYESRFEVPEVNV